ncbi:MAG: hypothetical protein EOM68_19815 [Spirochaetia bacterium]|nr:hypothetical protein [Spirochaetia bacterium]
MLKRLARANNTVPFEKSPQKYLAYIWDCISYVREILDSEEAATMPNAELITLIGCLHELKVGISSVIVIHP